MSTLRSVARTAGQGHPVEGLASELAETGWTCVTLDHAPRIDSETGMVSSGDARFSLASDRLHAANGADAAAAMTAALEALERPDWAGAEQQAALALADPDTVAAALYVTALCCAALDRHAEMARIARFLDDARLRHPGPTALAGYAAFLEGDDATGRKTMARAARKGRRTPDYSRTLKFVQKTLLEQHFGS